MDLRKQLTRLHVDPSVLRSGTMEVRTPIDGSKTAMLAETSVDDLARILVHSQEAYEAWREVPAPRRGELVRIFGDVLTEYKQPLAELVTAECGKIMPEALGEVQEMIDMCVLAAGLSRQIDGQNFPSERPGHRIMERWHPLGPVLVISAFNFPVAVWAWNATLALICGNSVVWKPSEKTPLTALACQSLLKIAMQRFGDTPRGLSSVVLGGATLGNQLVRDERFRLVSATGSCAMGKKVAPLVAQRMGRSLLELGGNNAMIVTPSADLSLAERAILFSAVGTAGQRCTTLRRLFVHESIYNDVMQRVKTAYEQIVVGNPYDKESLIGPLIDKQSFEQMQHAIDFSVRESGGKLIGGDRLYEDSLPNAYYVNPAIVELPYQTLMMLNETFAPILYCVKYNDLDLVLKEHNRAKQGLSSCIFSNDMREIEKFISASGSDCGIANVNIGPSGAEIGGAFGGEKETGGGREAGSDSWKSYMRRVTITVNGSAELPLAQGISFGKK